MNAEAQPAGFQPVNIRTSDPERRQVVSALQAECVEGRLSLDEYGQRVERAFAARTRSELEALQSDLPAQVSWPALTREAAPASGASTTMAVLGSADRRGFWRLPKDNRVVSILGSRNLDLREAHVSAPITTIEVFVLLGSVNVVVAPGVQVDIESSVLLGSREMRLSGAPPSLGGPVTRITGAVVLGSLTVLDRGSAEARGAPALDAD